MLEPGIFGQRDGKGPCVAVLQSHEPAHRGMPQLQTAIPEYNLGFQHLVGLLQPGLLELRQCLESWSEIIVQGEMRQIDRMGVQKDCGGLACFLTQPCHVVRKTLRVPDFEAEGSCCLKLFLAHSEASSTGCHCPPQDEIPVNHTTSPAVKY